MIMSEVKRFSLVKPTVDTPFHIDFDWWKHQEKNWRVYLIGYLCQEHQAAYADSAGDTWIDWIDPQTAEVTSVDGLQHTLITHCAKQADFVNLNTSMVDSVFRILLAHGNNALSPSQLAGITGRSAETILRTLSGSVVYKGIRPLHS
jgi:hypothetical protein